MVALFSEPPPDLLLPGQRLFLRPPRRADYPQWRMLREFSRSFLTPWEPSWPHDALGRAAYRRRLKRISLEWRDDLGYSFHIFTRHEDRLLGGIALSNIRRGVAQSASIGYWIGQPHANRGYMTEAIRAVLRFGFEDLGLHRIEAACLPRNAPSRAVLRKAGFSEEGLARRYLRINGAWEDHALYAILREDLPNL